MRQVRRFGNCRAAQRADPRAPEVGDHASRSALRTWLWCAEGAGLDYTRVLYAVWPQHWAC